MDANIFWSRNYNVVVLPSGRIKRVDAVQGVKLCFAFPLNRPWNHCEAWISDYLQQKYFTDSHLPSLEG